MFNTYRAGAAIAVIVALTSPASSMVINGGFELSPGVAGVNGNTYESILEGTEIRETFDAWQTLPGWTALDGGVIEVQTEGTLGNVDVPFGNYYVELDAEQNRSMFQTIFLTAGRYVLDFWYTPRVDDADTNGIDYSIAGLSGAVEGPNETFERGVWNEISAFFDVEEDAYYDLTFAASGTSDRLGGLIDNVSIESVGVAAVPLPASALLMIAGLGALGATRRRKAS